jgi:DNA polymerase-3 subunit delta
VSPAKIIEWRKAQPASVVLIFGPEQHFASEATREIRQKLREKHPMLEIQEVDASDYASGHLINVASPSLFAEPRLILVDNVERCTDAFIEDGKKYLADPASDTTVVLRHNGSSVRGKALLDAIRASDTAIEIPCPKSDKDFERSKFVQTEFAHAGRMVTDGAVRALVQAFSQDIPELAQAVSQLLLDSSETITEEIVDKYYGGRVETDNFVIIDVALAGKAGDALFLFRHARATGVDMVPMVYGWANKVRSLAKVFADPRATAQSLGLSTTGFNKAKEAIRGWDDEGIGRLLQMIAECDSATKGGERNAEFRLEQFLLAASNKARTS